MYNNIPMSIINMEFSNLPAIADFTYLYNYINLNYEFKQVIFLILGRKKEFGLMILYYYIVHNIMVL